MQKYLIYDEIVVAVNYRKALLARAALLTNEMKRLKELRNNCLAASQFQPDSEAHSRICAYTKDYTSFAEIDPLGV